MSHRYLNTTEQKLVTKVSSHIKYQSIAKRFILFIS